MIPYLIVSTLLWAFCAWLSFHGVPDTPGGLRVAHIFIFFIYGFMATGSFVLLINLWEMQP